MSQYRVKFTKKIVYACQVCKNGVYVLRTARATGQNFYGCSAFPSCKSTLSLEKYDYLISNNVLASLTAKEIKDRDVRAVIMRKTAVNVVATPVVPEQVKVIPKQVKVKKPLINKDMCIPMPGITLYNQRIPGGIIVRGEKIFNVGRNFMFPDILFRYFTSLVKNYDIGLKEIVTHVDFLYGFVKQEKGDFKLSEPVITQLKVWTLNEFLADKDEVKEFQYGKKIVSNKPVTETVEQPTISADDRDIQF